MGEVIHILESDIIGDDNFDELPCRDLGTFNFAYMEYDMSDDDVSYFNLNVRYTGSKYREVREVRAFGLHSLFGNIGGYFGIFIGYALFNLPDLVVKINNRIRRKDKNNTAETTDDKEVRNYAIREYMI